MIGTSRSCSQRWSARFYARYRKGAHYLEDTNNTARADFSAPAGIPHDPYVPNLCNVGTRRRHDPRRDRQRLDVRHRQPRRRLHEVLRGDGGVRVARRQADAQRLVHVEPLLRQLRPGQLVVQQRQ